MSRTVFLGSLCQLVLSVAMAAAVSQTAVGADATPKPEEVQLWSGPAAIGDGKTEAVDVPLTLFRPAADKATGAAVVICPGGAYAVLALEPEGFGIARWLSQHGIAALVLQYRMPAQRSFVPLLDAQRAIRTVRANAKSWGIDPARIGILGFSAGGHLASTAGTHFDAGDPNAADPVDRVSCRPDFMILIYPVITMGEKTNVGSKVNLLGQNPKPEMIELFSNEKQVTDKTPPAFIAHAQDDTGVVPDNSQMFYDALKAHHVAAEYLRLPYGNHGLNGYKGPMWDAWQEGSLAWLKGLKIVP